MKRFAITSLLFICCFSLVYCQHEFRSEADIYQAKEIMFYGYDYSHFRIADAKRMDEDLKKFVFLWIGFCQEHITERKLPSWLDKERVTFNFDPTMALNKKLTSDDLGAATKHAIPKDSIQSFTDEYSLAEKEGIGFVVIVECFDNSTKRTSAYFTFFDIATKKVLDSEYISSRDGNSYNRVSDWGSALVTAFKKFVSVYSDNRKRFRSTGH